MNAQTVSRTLAPKLVRPVVIVNGLIGYPHVFGTDYERGAEHNAVRALLARGFTTSGLTVSKYASVQRLYVIAPPDFDADVYQRHMQDIADGATVLGAECGFTQFLCGLTYDAGAQSGPHGNADAWLDFTQTGNVQNAVFWSFNAQTMGALLSALRRLD